MRNYKELIKKAYSKDLGEDMMWHIADMTNNFIESIRPLHTAEVDKFLEEMENDICFPKLTKESAEYYVSEMVNKDGSKGGHWTFDQVKVYKDNHTEYKDLDDICFYVAINMMYSDYYKPSMTTDNYAAMAKDFITDKDAPSNKVARYISVMK